MYWKSSNLSITIKGRDYMCRSLCLVVGYVCCMECKYLEECKHVCAQIDLSIVNKDTYKKCGLYNEKAIKDVLSEYFV